MRMTEKLERAAGTLLSVNARSDFDLEPVCKLLKEAHDYILQLEAELSEAECDMYELRCDIYGEWP